MGNAYARFSTNAEIERMMILELYKVDRDIDYPCFKRLHFDSLISFLNARLGSKLYVCTKPRVIIFQSFAVIVGNSLS